MALVDNLVSYWKLDETSGNRADSHGTNTLIDSGADGDTGILNGCASFGGSPDHLLAEDVAPSGATSVSFWFNAPSLPMPLCSFYTSELGFGLTADTDKITATYGGGGGPDDFTATGLTTATWYHVVFTHDGAGNVECYVNGASVGTHAGTITDGGYFDLGVHNGNLAYATGLIDEVGYWSRVLNSSEVTELYNSGSGLSYDAINPATGNRRRRLILGASQ